jgi:hypothetical protein
MNKHGAKIELWDNLRDLWERMTGKGKEKGEDKKN